MQAGTARPPGKASEVRRWNVRSSGSGFLVSCCPAPDPGAVGGTGQLRRQAELHSLNVTVHLYTMDTKKSRLRKVGTV